MARNFLIELTRINGIGSRYETTSLCYINIDYIANIYINHFIHDGKEVDGSVVKTDSGCEYFCLETPDEITSLIKNILSQ